MKRTVKIGLLTFAGGLVIGALIILAIRFFTYKPDKVHYHANFAVYINGQREQFKGARYYEETGATTCSAANENGENPTERAHMHDNVNDVVHVEDHLVTWGNFFQNLGWTINPELIQSPSQVLLADATHKITFILNGKTVSDVTSTVIQDQDKLLVDYGDSGSTLQAEYNSIPSTAKQEDQSKDPASCGGSAPTTTSDRLHHLF